MELGVKTAAKKALLPAAGAKATLSLRQVLTQQLPRALQQGRTRSDQSIPDGHEFKGIPHALETMQQSQLDIRSVSFAGQTLLIC